MPRPPSTVDQALRHLLIDVTGNTHRAEICIDKLSRRTAATGRLGLVELRAFEMPPHARMSLAQQLLVRALVALFWQKPDRGAGRPDRGPSCTIDSCYPYFIERDFRSVEGELRRSEHPFSVRLVDPHLEFRLPARGRSSCTRRQLTLRHALEQSHVLGGENSGGGATSSSTRRSSGWKLLGLRADRRSLRQHRLQRPAGAPAPEPDSTARPSPASAPAPRKRHRACTRCFRSIPPSPSMSSTPRSSRDRFRAPGPRGVPADARLDSLPSEQLQARAAARSLHTAARRTHPGPHQPLPSGASVPLHASACERLQWQDHRWQTRDSDQPAPAAQRSARKRRTHCAPALVGFNRFHGARPTGADTENRSLESFRQIHENGVAYNVHHDRHQPQRPSSPGHPALIDARRPLVRLNAAYGSARGC